MNRREFIVESVCFGAAGLGLPLTGCRTVAPNKVRMMAIAHRGLHGRSVGIAQNSIESFKAAYAAGAKWIETDFHVLLNGRVLCVHDRVELKNLSGVDHAIASLTEADVAAIDIGKFAQTAKPVHMPYLEDVLKCVPKDAFAQCEVKLYRKSYPELFDAAVKAAGLTERNILISSGSLSALADFHKQKPNYRMLWLVAGVEPRISKWDVDAAIQKAKEAGVDILCPSCKVAMKIGVTPAEADRVRAAGLDFRLFGVNSPEMLAYATSVRATAFTTDNWKKSFEWARAIPNLELVSSLD